MKLRNAVSALLLTSVLSMTGCASPVPIAASCPPFPKPPPSLMTAPAILDFSKYYDSLKSKPGN